MWQVICFTVLHSGILVLILYSLGETGKKVVLPAVIAGVVVAVTESVLLLNHADLGCFFSLLAGGLAFLLCGKFFRISLLPAVTAVLLTVTTENILYPLFLAGWQRPEIWEYAGYILIALLAVALSFVMNQGHGIRKQAFENQGQILWKNSWFSNARREGDISNWMLLIPTLALMAEVLLSISYQKSTAFFMICTITVMLLIPGAAIVILYLLVSLKQHQKGERNMMEWQKESKDYMNLIRSQRHDFNFHLHALVGLVESGEYEECRCYLKKMAGEASDINDIMPVSDAVVGSMLYNMREEARKRGSDITYDITYDMQDILCNGFECNKIIGNLLQNAIDALDSPEDRKMGIQLSIFKRRGNTVITVENRFTGERARILRAFEAGYSTKRKHEGIGLSMVMRTVQRYGGRIYPEFEEERVRFIVNIPNKVRLE